MVPAPLLTRAEPDESHSSALETSGRMPGAFRLWAVLVLLCSEAVAGGPANVLVVVNQWSAVSKIVGEYYVRKRMVPRRNICFIQTGEQETVSRDVYRQEIEKPVAACLISRELAESILYIVTTLGVPLRIAGKNALDGDSSSVDSELTLAYSVVQGKQHGLNGPLANPFFRAGSAFRHPDFPIYLVTRLAGYDFQDVRGLIDRAPGARNRGKFVLDLSMGDETGDGWLRAAAARLPADRVIIDRSGSVLYEQKDVIGYASWGSNDKHRTRRWTGFQWLPGAIMTEFVSTDGRTFQRPPETWNIGSWIRRDQYFAGSPQSLSADFVHEGATGVSGHVDEPYLAFTPRPDYLLPAYYKGRNLAESYYLSIPALSWSNIVIGDPLCRLEN